MLGAIQKIKNDLNAMKTLGEIHTLKNQLGELPAGHQEMQTFFTSMGDEFVSLGEALLDVLKLYMPADVLASLGSGYGLNHLINKDKTDSNLRTSLTVAGGAVAGTVVSGGTSYLYLQSKLDDLRDRGIIVEARMQDFEFTIPSYEEYKAIKDGLKTLESFVENMERYNYDFGIQDADQLRIVDRAISALSSFFFVFNVTRYTRYCISAANAYHGYKRNGGGGAGVGFGLLWFLFGGASGLGVALSQGYGKEI